MENCWRQVHKSSNLSWMAMVKRCGKILMRWDSEIFKRTQWRIAWLKKRMQRLRSLPQNRIVVDECREVEKEIRELRRDEETAA